MRIEDEALLAAFRAAARCEFCGKPTPQGCDPAHIFSRGAGRLDISCNLCSLCWPCHRIGNHGGDITRFDLLTVAAKREKCLQDDIVRCVYFIRALPKETTWGSFDIPDSIPHRAAILIERSLEKHLQLEVDDG